VTLSVRKIGQVEIISICNSEVTLMQTGKQFPPASKTS